MKAEKCIDVVVIQTERAYSYDDDKSVRIDLLWRDEVSESLNLAEVQNNLLELFRIQNCTGSLYYIFPSLKSERLLCAVFNSGLRTRENITLCSVQGAVD